MLCTKLRTIISDAGLRILADEYEVPAIGSLCPLDAIKQSRRRFALPLPINNAPGVPIIQPRTRRLGDKLVLRVGHVEIEIATKLGLDRGSDKLRWGSS
jgi:hypothetical protein